ncbi:class I SAM-dependent methyltransferase [Chloroflexota bacterium]
MITERIKYDRFNPAPWGAHSRVVKLIGNNKRVLDVGCATGEVARELKMNGCSVIGIEIDPHQAKIAQEVCDEVIKGDIETMDLGPMSSSFNVVLMADVLEHLKDPLQTLKNASRLLSDDGFAIIVLPNIAHLWFRLKLLAGQFDYVDKGTLDRTHLRFFTLKTVKKLITEAGCTIELVDVSIPNVPASLALNSHLKPVYRLAHAVARLWKTMFAFQFIVKVRLAPGYRDKE